jgi:hypothetical protein
MSRIVRACETGMIEFPCKCGYAFSVPAEMAGSVIQCPECGLLADIPTATDLASILPDGTYIIDQPPAPRPDQLLDAMLVFNRSHLDPDGTERDMRLTAVDTGGVGAPASNESIHPLALAPKYDPETGELLRPMKVVPREHDGVAIPTAKAAIAYAMPGLQDGVPPSKVFLELLAPVNVFVMGFIVLFHLIAQALVLTLSVMFPAGALFVVIVAILAHYGCVVEDVGREEIDELPRPLRGLNILEDLWWPFCNIIGSLILSYVPALFAMTRWNDGTRMHLFGDGFLLMLGTILFPAILLTLLTSGSMLNLRPDRLLGLMGASARGYSLLVLGWLLSAAIYASGVISFDRCVVFSLFTAGYHVERWAWVVSISLLLVGIYAMHLFCWELGLFYRLKNASFPWLFQRHIKRVRLQKAGQLRPKMRVRQVAQPNSNH